MKERAYFTAIILLCTVASDTLADKWTRFQNGGNLSLRNQTGVRLKWNTEQGIRWDVDLAGYGQSSPVIHDQTVYVTSLSGDSKEKLFIQAFDQVSGTELWKHETVNKSPEENTNYVSRAAPSPVCDAQGVIAFFEGGNVVALDAIGNVRWQRDLIADVGPIEARHGLASSLEQNDHTIFIWVERLSDPYVMALEKSSGKTKWKAAGLGVTSWSSPRLVPGKERHHLVLSGTGKLAGLDPQSGERLWTFDAISGNSTPTPMPVGPGRFLIGASAGSGASSENNAAQSNGLIQIEETSHGKYSAKYVWQAERATSSFGSPIAHKGNAYFVNRTGVLFCLDLKTGKEHFAKRIGSSTWATAVGMENRVYFFGKNGMTTVIRSGPEFQELSTNPLWNDASDRRPPRPNFGVPILYGVAISESDLIMRRGDRMYNVSAL